MNRDAMEAMKSMKDYAESLCRENYGSSLTQIGEEVYSQAQVCIDAISARSEWCIEELPYREHAYKTSVDSYTNALLELLRRVKRAGDILKKPDEFESVRTYQLYQYCGCISQTPRVFYMAGDCSFTIACHVDSELMTLKITLTMGDFLMVKKSILGADERT